MSNQRWAKFPGLRVSLAVFSVIVLLSLGGFPLASDARASHDQVIEVEVAENGTRFAPDETPTVGGLPAYGAEFITEGYIYPKGTLSCVNNECNGVNPDGTPEFPDRVKGKWICRGWHVGEGALTVSGPWVATTQIFDFGTRPGARTIVTDGFEYADFNEEFSRAIIGGSGRYRNAQGEQKQEFLGWNESFGTTLRMKLRLSDD